MSTFDYIAHAALRFCAGVALVAVAYAFGVVSAEARQQRAALNPDTAIFCQPLVPLNPDGAKLRVKA